MCSHFRKWLLLFVVTSTPCVAQSTVRVCADPDNLPFSRQDRSGFDNRIAEVLIRKLGKQPQFVWARARRGFLRERFNHGDCDVLMGVPVGMKRVLQTIPYYTSSYLFVTRTQDHLHLTGFDDPHIGSQRIGLQVLQEDFSPPSLPLIQYGHATQLVGFGAFGAETAKIIHAVATRNVGMAVVWGPVAGYFANKERVPLTLTPVNPPVLHGIPFRYNMAIAVHSHDVALAKELDGAIVQEHEAIQHILHTYHVPQAPRSISQQGGKQ